MPNTTTTERQTRQAFSPSDVLAATNLRVHDFVIKIVNDALCNGARAKPIPGVSIRISKEELEAQITEEAMKLGVNPNDTNWGNFPMVFSKYWDIQVPPCSTAGLFGRDLDCYVFTPKGVVSRGD